MADLVTHACTALLPGALFPSVRYLPLVTLGTVLPDLLGRVVPMALEPFARLGLPEQLLWPWSGLHQPAGWLLVAALLSFAFAERERPKVLQALIVGCTLHLGLDLLQDHHGEGYVLLAPFSTTKWELGLIGSEATVGVAIPLLVVTAIAWAVRLKVRGRTPPSRALPHRTGALRTGPAAAMEAYDHRRDGARAGRS